MLNRLALPTWTLAVEEFYLLAPLLLVLGPRRRLLSLILAGMAAAPLFRLVVFGSGGPWLGRLVATVP